MEDPRCRFLLEIATGRTYVTADDKRGPIDRVVFRNIDVAVARPPPSSLRGENAAARIADVLFENVRFAGQPVTDAAGLNLKVGRHVENVRFAVPQE